LPAFIIFLSLLFFFKKEFVLGNNPELGYDSGQKTVVLAAVVAAAEGGRRQ
jgi:hypothetical protein